MHIFTGDPIIIWDTEYTSREWAMARNWSWPNEYKELVQLWAILVDPITWMEVDSFQCFVKPRINATLSDFFVSLTEITQAQIDTDGIDFAAALQQFMDWTKNREAYSFGGDEEILQINCELYNIPRTMKNIFHDARDVFRQAGIPAEKYNSGTINKYFNIPNNDTEHNALADARNILSSLKTLYSK